MLLTAADQTSMTTSPLRNTGSLLISARASSSSLWKYFKLNKEYYNLAAIEGKLRMHTTPLNFMIEC
jgi:hypothetical protein